MAFKLKTMEDKTMDWLRWVLLGVIFVGILVFAGLFAGFGLNGLFWNENIDPLTRCCLILASLLLLGAGVWLIYRELRNQEVQSQRKELLSLLDENKCNIENYRLEYHKCVEKVRKILGEVNKDNVNALSSLIDKICEGDRKILEKLLSEREQIIRALLGGKSDSDSC